MAKGTQRAIPNSKQGRRLVRIGVDVDLSNQSQEVKDWNAAIEAKKSAKHCAKSDALYPTHKVPA